MKLLIIGVNHKTAPIALREQLAFTDDEMGVALQQLQEYSDSCLILSTCNRSEIYALLTDNDATSNENYHHKIIHWLAQYKGIDYDTLNAHIYSYSNHNAISHWIRVATGLDSMIIGESHIVGQLKSSVQQALNHGTINKKLGWLVDQIFASAKYIRHTTNIGSQAVTLEFAVAKLANDIFADLSQCHLLIIATGKINRLVAHYITEQNIGTITLANRSSEKSYQLAQQLQEINPHCIINVIELTELDQHLPSVDIVSSCSGSSTPLINVAMVKKVIQNRPQRPILMIDLAVPRDIEAEVQQLANIHLYAIDDLQEIIADNLAQRRQTALEAEVLVSQLVLDIEQKFLIRQVGSDIHAYRQLAFAQADDLLQKSLQSLQQGNKSAEEVLTEFSYKLTQNLTHAPSRLMRTLACEADPSISNMVLHELTNSYRSKD